MLRVMTWNIRTGGEDRGDPQRLERVVEVVREQRPDLLALQELRNFRRAGRLERFAEAVGLRPYLARSSFGQPVAVLVRPPGRAVVAAPVRRPFHHAAQRVVVPTDAGDLTVIGTHLHPFSGGRRRREAGWLAAAVRAAGERVLLMGDLNSLDPWTDHAERVGSLAPRYRGRHLDGGRVDTRAVARLHDEAGLQDLYLTAGPPGEGCTVPTSHGGAEFTAMRLDYLLGTPAVAASTRFCGVLRGGRAESASDHYPVSAELDLNFA
ncbi:endonuclease/exonuclease/phosphatase family protein [Micromonosporaceae bacterium DT55]|uniref:endonuclease/exonuclease/phosphatase family protein n=1 Tax=Melissospora conviva TaxID=3388432 RepID=UPI003C13FCAC